MPPLFRPRQIAAVDSQVGPIATILKGRKNERTQRGLNRFFSKRIKVSNHWKLC